MSSKIKTKVAADDQIQRRIRIPFGPDADDILVINQPHFKNMQPVKIKVLGKIRVNNNARPMPAKTAKAGRKYIVISIKMSLQPRPKRRGFNNSPDNAVCNALRSNAGRPLVRWGLRRRPDICRGARNDIIIIIRANRVS